MSADKIMLRHDNPEKLKCNRRFRIAIQLSRLLNALRANQRQYLRMPDDDTPANRRDRLELILYHGAIVFEATKTMQNYGGALSQTETWEERQDTVHRIQVETNNSNSFTQKYLKLIRNKLLFHYDITAIDEVLKDYPLDKDIVFAEAASESMLSLTFVLADKFVLYYLIQQIEENLSATENWEFFEERLLEISEDICTVLYGCIIDLIKNCAYIEENAQQNNRHVLASIKSLILKVWNLFKSKDHNMSWD